MFRLDRFARFLRVCALMILTVRPGVAADPDGIVDKDGIKPRGEWYEATVSDTLDLAERAEYSINALSRNLEPDKSYAVLQGFNYGADNYAISGLTWNITPKNLRGLPMMRTMCGSEKNIDIEYEAMRALVRQVHPDGQIYYPFDQDGPPKDTSYPLFNGIAGLTFLRLARARRESRVARSGPARLSRTEELGDRSREPRLLAARKQRQAGWNMALHGSRKR